MPSKNFDSDEAFSEVTDIVHQFEAALDVADLVHLLRKAAAQLGADSACYLSVVREGDVIASIRSLLACDPLWGLIYEQLLLSNESDPWLGHASRNSAPVCGSAIGTDTDATGETQDLAARHGFRSSFIVPIHAGGALPARRIVRFGILVLGSSSVGFFEQAATTTLRMLARSLAMELHESYSFVLSRGRIRADAVSPVDLELLRRDRAGETTKAIARGLRTTPHAIDQRFYRLGMKLGARSRHAAVRLAVEYGLI